MSQPRVTFSQIKALVAAVRRKVPDARVIGIQEPRRWTGDRLRQDGSDTYRIEQCDSSLAARIALLDDGENVTTTVLLTPLGEKDLGEDVKTRLAGRKLYAINNWQIVKALFQAQAVDPRLRAHTWIAEQLVDLIPIGGYAPAPGGFLDAETVWPYLLGRLVGLAGDHPDLPGLLRWSASTDNVTRLRRTPDEFRRAAAEWLSALAGPAAATVLRCVTANDLPDALPVGLTLGVVHHPRAAGQLDKAAGRLERFLGGPTPEQAVLDRWHAAAVEAVKLLDGDPRLKGQLLDRADAILDEVQARPFADLSDVLPLGFAGRLARFGRLLDEAVEGTTDLTVALQDARDQVRQHDLARREPRRLERVEMALRLARWLCRPARPEPQSLAEAAQQHLSDSSYVDWARSVLRASEPVRALAEGYARLLEEVTSRRECENRTFAELLRDWTAPGSVGAGLIPVERILDDVVAPLAAAAPVLLIVADGMSAAVARELTADLTRQDWIMLGEGGRPIPPGLAAIPSVTEACRTSLFCGRLCTGAAHHEAAGFAEHIGLRKHCRSGAPPVLFHKVALQEGEDAGLAAAVRQAIASPQKRIVGVVLNAVDDHLLKGEQLDLRWTRDEIKVLPSLLYEARSARRVVVLVSDHGHVLDRHTQARAGDGGERWRPDDGQLADGELAMRGHRVLIPEGGRLIAPWSEKIRYGAKKNGYHGGLAPQEMLIAITVLASGDVRVGGWDDVPDAAPDWWDEPAPVQKPVEFTPPPRPVVARKPESLWDYVEPEPQAPQPQPPATPAPICQAPWLTALLGSPVFADQKKLAGRAVPPDDLFRRLLGVLDEHGGRLTGAALARRLEIPAFRLRGLLAVVQRVLNVDGYPVLGRDEASDTVELNRELLCRQFDLIAEDRRP